MTHPFPPIGRLRLPVRLAACCLGLSVAVAAVDPCEAAGQPFLYGGDISALTVLEEAGVTYRDRAGMPADAIGLMKAAGMNTFRLRLFVDPVPEGIVTNDLEYTLKLARRIVRRKATLLLDLHYSDTWADPAHQTKPKAWADLPFEALEQRVEDYTASTLKRFVDEGLRPDLVQLGNEITNGMLWPDGRVEFSESADPAAWERFGRLQRAAGRGFARVFPDPDDRPQVVLHIESTGNLPRTRWYLERAQEHGVTFDMVGFSYYPEWHGTLDDLGATLALAASVSGKPVLVAEIAYPWKTGEHWVGKPNLAFPLTPEGQRDFLDRAIRVVREVPDGRGAGLIWWYPEAVENPRVNVWLAGANGLFDNEGRVLPALMSRRVP